ncbi:MAG TPA: hypothetical protein VKV26_24495 [Dehalococcoidia bacterium]|nr:hypothetical protein [Dehalococcoidia bacterium]
MATADLSQTPAFQAGYSSGAEDARQHRRRNHLLDDLPGLNAFAGDSALLACRERQPRLRGDEVDQYVAGYIAAYQQTAGRPAAGEPCPASGASGPIAVARGRLQPMALRRAHRASRKSSRARR